MLADDPATLAGRRALGARRRAPRRAEVAVVVGDCHQGQGLGTALGIALADGARARGIARFTAMMLPENTAAQRLFAHISGRLSTRVEGGTYELVADLAA